MNVLITGERGYIAGQLKDALSGNSCKCETKSLRAGLPELLGYDTVIHCAALVHSKEKDPDSFYRVNTKLTADLAEKAKSAGVRRFIFMSSIAVYGVSGSLRGTAVIDAHTPENPVTLYGKSKLMAENELRGMADRHFSVYILRLPMVYGEGAPGNYARLCRLVKIAPVFPDVSNARSMISVENLRHYVISLVESIGETLGCIHVMYPRDPKPVCTARLAVSIAAAQGKTLRLSPLLGWLVLMFPVEPALKLFGSLMYAEDL
ncbi:MAG: NAD-dependent epimerase/dehydratase family protein [Clostridiales bacterium]|nr:NAD-dependent epimerase/dehydratase family protein [Clostridiales bacterium]